MVKPASTPLSNIIATAFADSLRLNYIGFITIDRKVFLDIPISYRHSVEGIMHYIANSLILRRIKICLENVSGVLVGYYKGVHILSSIKPGISSDAIIVRRDRECLNNITSTIYDTFIQVLPKIPIFIIDLSLWEVHHKKEKESLVKQLVVTLDVVRRWLTDLHLVFSSTPLEVLHKIQNIMTIATPYFRSSEVYTSIDPHRTVMLDPYASETLTDDDVFNYDYFVIGGIIDRLYPRPYATYMIYKMHELNVTRRSIKLRGSIIGVPNEINKIIDIILTTRLGGIPLERAIIKNMSMSDKITRIIYEVEKCTKTNKGIDMEYIRSIMELLNLSNEHLSKIFIKIKRLMS